MSLTVSKKFLMFLGAMKKLPSMPNAAATRIYHAQAILVIHTQDLEHGTHWSDAVAVAFSFNGLLHMFLHWNGEFHPTQTLICTHVMYVGVVAAMVEELKAK
jgi:hypothetical protein